MTVLVTGGAGYIGSHTLVCLLNLGYEVVVYDNLVNSSIKALRRVEEISGKQLEFVEGDVTDSRALDNLFAKYSIDAVYPFCSVKSSGGVLSAAFAIL